MSATLNDMVDFMVKHTDITRHLLSCHMCKYKWRSYQVERCPSCARGFGIPFMDIMVMGREEDLMEAVQEIKPHESDDNFLCVRHTIMKHCWWYRLGTIWNTEGCWNAQACWNYLHEQPTTPEIKMAMDYFQTSFEELVIDLDDHGFPIQQEDSIE